MKYRKVKPRRSRFKTNKILYIFLLFLFIGVGYSSLNTSLSINGTTNVATNSWNIHFANLQLKSGSVTGSPEASIAVGNMSITYGAELAQPGDYYEFNVEVKNEGTLPGKISIVNITGNNTNYLSTSYKYSNGIDINLGDIINAGKTIKIKVKAWIPSDIDTSLLPTEDTNITLTFNLQYVQSEVDAPLDVAEQMIALAANNSCIEKYEGQVTDEVGVTKTAKNVYFNKCADKRNVKFAGFCWEIIRTTETGGIKIIYNGEPDANNECKKYIRSSHKGIVQTYNMSQSLDNNYLYGDSFTYNISTNEFTLVDTTSETWGDSTYQNLLGKFTCKNTNGTCTTLYQINSYASNTSAYLSYYTITDTNYAQIGTSSYNANYYSLAMVGYMFNKVYNWVGSSPYSGMLEGNDVSYSNGTYTLLPASGESSLITSLDNTHHYSCNNTTGICDKVRYYYYKESSTGYYIELDGETNIEEAISNMLYGDGVNRYNSSIKGIIDSWYAQNIISKTNMLEDAIFCNARNMSNQSTNGWNKDGELATYMNFKNYNSTTNLACPNATDQFSVSNNKARLIYPVSLIQDEERYNINTASLIDTGTYYWELSSSYYEDTFAYGLVINSSGNIYNNPVGSAQGIRPVVSLASGAMISSGTGSESDPFVIQE